MPYIPPLKAEFFKALSHPVRIRVLELLSEGERPVADLQRGLELEQSHLSQQLGVLRRAGLVRSRREGSSVVYSLADPRIADILAIARQILLDAVTLTREQLASQ